MSKTRRYGPLVAWVAALVIVRSAIRAHGFHWTWIVVGLLVLFGVASLLRNWRRGAATTVEASVREHPHARPHVRPPSEPRTIPFRRKMLVFFGIFGLGFGAMCGAVAFIVFRDLGLSYWLGDIFGPFMVLGCALFSWWAVFALRGLLGRHALILDADGLTDQSSPIPLGRVAWDDVQAIHWQWPGTLYAVRPFVAIDRQNGRDPVSEPSSTRRLLGKLLRSRGVDPSKLAVSDEELAHLFRSYSGGRFGIAER